MLTIDSIPAKFIDQFPEGTSIHGILAAFLTHGDPELLSELDVWRGVWPDWEEFESSMPIFWPKHLRASNSTYESSSPEDSQHTEAFPIILPPSISGLWNSPPHQSQQAPTPYETRYQNLLAQQEKRLKAAWDSVISVFPGTDWKSFAYNWSIINSRSFYYVSPGKEEPADWNDAIGMVPYADYFNHVDDAECEVKFDGRKYTFKATRSYEKGEEIYMSYGSHSNDFLLVEYGFCLENNPSDAIYLDDIIIPALSQEQKEELAAHDCLGNYNVTADGVDERITATANIMSMSPEDWQKYVNGEIETQQAFSLQDTGRIICEWIQEYLKQSAFAVDAAKGVLMTAEEGSEKSTKEKLDLILSRWKQIQQLCENALESTSQWAKLISKN
ncbi:hypothetical protein BJX63DRAFT_382647 [Aspergillus granulosus]|uniref:SET domain-containing protein n=1 Tax=Aspergillus granulosus TaxID=176169 RepID=A0ABR4HUX0_9EURO